MTQASILLLAVSQVEVQREGVRILREVSLQVRSGQWMAVVGPNGSGKSTLLGLLAGRHVPRSGAVALRGRPLAEWPLRARSRELAWLPQQADLEADLVVRDVVRLGRLPHQGLYGAWTSLDEEAVNRALEEWDIVALADRRMNALSGGERQRVLLARVFATDSDMILLDEPTTYLDAPHQLQLCRSLVDRARQGRAVVSVLHDLNLALAADRVVVLDGGRVAGDGAPDDPGVHRAILQAFEEAVELHPLPARSGPRWVAVPSLAGTRSLSHSSPGEVR